MIHGLVFLGRAGKSSVKKPMTVSG